MFSMAGGAKRRTLEQLLNEAQARIDRLLPHEAFAAVSRGAVMIDIRSAVERERDGIVPGSLHIPRTVLEWRLDPDSPWRNPSIGGLDQQIVLVCDDGCSSILAAATLADLGFTQVGDVVGGFAAWREAELPATQSTPYRLDSGERAGMRPPDL
jgi:rhodanese-related sulfurtransferase